MLEAVVTLIEILNVKANHAYSIPCMSDASNSLVSQYFQCTCTFMCNMCIYLLYMTCFSNPLCYFATVTT